MHTDARTTSTISVAEDSADSDEIHKLVQLYRSEGEKLQSHGIWTVVTANSVLEVASSDICISVDFTGGFSNSEISARSIRIQKIKNLPIADHYTPRTIKAGILICAGKDFHKGISNRTRNCPWDHETDKNDHSLASSHYMQLWLRICLESDRNKATKLAELCRAECLRETEMPAVSFNMADAGVDAYCQHAAVQSQFASTAIS
ncbi:hypothetical protein E4U19_002286 [Claviceps sp. Clav32 group G5]|nr:hypothetical protein E4U19_002286 [Claviceps sp. Clav32 group G5]